MEKALEILKKHEDRNAQVNELLDKHFPDRNTWKSPDQEIVELNLPADPLCPMAFVTRSHMHNMEIPKHATGATCTVIRKDIIINSKKVTYYHRGYCHLCYCPGEYEGWNSGWYRSKEWEKFYVGCKRYQEQVDKWQHRLT